MYTVKYVDETTSSITLKNGMSVLIDTEDVVVVLRYVWHVTPAGYAMNRGNKRVSRGAILMHRLITGAERGQCVDHINHNRLDNRKSNLRLCSYSENGRNRRKNNINKSSRFKGVSYRKQHDKWRAAICISGDSKSKELGLFLTEEEAALAYNAAAIKYFGEFARLNDVNQ